MIYNELKAGTVEEMRFAIRRCRQFFPWITAVVRFFNLWILASRQGV